MCGIVAVTETADRKAILRGLVANCMLELGEQALASGEAAAETLDTLYGLQVPVSVAQEAIDGLLDSGLLNRSATGHLELSAIFAKERRGRIETAKHLEATVRDGWVAELAASAPELDGSYMWAALLAYLFRAFRRHGIQAAALLDPSFDPTPEESEALSSLLEEAIKAEVPAVNHEQAQALVSEFVARSGEHEDRSAYMVQLADGAFTYYSVTVSPEVADAMRGYLRPLRLFFDTNFLFGLLGLGDRLTSDIGEELLAVIKTDSFPFELCYHVRTDREINNSIAHYESLLKSRHWQIAVARAAEGDRKVPGVMRQYFSIYIQNGVDVATFFRPYRHVDVVLEERGIRRYEPSDAREEERATLLASYQDYLDSRRKVKSYSVVEHDATVLDAVRALRHEGVGSSLEVGALLVTNDYFLYRFDWEQSRRMGKRPSVVLPSLLWQVLRPFTRGTKDFDRGFAETFALPEFRTVSGNAIAATEKLLGILASLSGLTEETAASMLSNDLLLDRLATATSEDALTIVDSALAEENRRLSERVAALAGEATKVSSELEVERRDRLALERERETFRSDEVTRSLLEERTIAAEARAQHADDLVETERSHRVRAERWLHAIQDGAIVLGSLCFGAAVTYYLPIVIPASVATHVPGGWSPRSLAGFSAALFVMGLLRRRWRKVVWSSSGGALVGVLLLLTLLR